MRVSLSLAHRLVCHGLYLCVSAFGCSTSTDPGSNGLGGSSGVSSGDGGTFGGNGDGGSNGPAECAAETKAIYVVSNEADLFRFAPEKSNAFTLVGRINCGDPSILPTSMAVDRQGTAWVRYDDESMMNVSIKDASCTRTKFRSGQANFNKFGMGFASDGKGGETLFLADSSGKGLASLDTKTLVVRLLGPFSNELFAKKAELTGTGDGKLYGFFPDFLPAKMAPIDTKTGSTSASNVLTGVEANAEWAFAFYAGDFYAFTTKAGAGLPMGDLGSAVTRYRPSDGSTTRILQLAFHIVGAGVSTCAPFTPIR
jgi:hypothetical protein